MPDIQLKALPPIWIQEKQPQAAHMPAQILREKPRLLDCVPEQIIKLGLFYLIYFENKSI